MFDDDSDADDYARDGLLYASRVPWLVSPEDRQLKLFACKGDYERWQQKQEQEQTKEISDDGTEDN